MHNLWSTLGCYYKSSVGQWVKINLFIFVDKSDMGVGCDQLVLDKGLITSTVYNT